MERKTCNDTLKYGCEDALKQLVIINGGIPHMVYSTIMDIIAK
jgi:hypothetical protein